MNKYLGIDYGAKRIGLAVSDDDGKMAFPHSIIENDRDVVSKILEICDKENINEIVLGESLNYSGEQNLIMEEIEKLRVRLLTKKTVHYEQEFLSSHQAAKSGQAEQLDASSAAIILQSYLDKKNEQSN